MPKSELEKRIDNLERQMDDIQHELKYHDERLDDIEMSSEEEWDEPTELDKKCYDRIEKGIEDETKKKYSIEDIDIIRILRTKGVKFGKLIIVAESLPADSNLGGIRVHAYGNSKKEALENLLKELKG